MRVIDAGHEYDLDSYDSGEPVRLTFVKREGEGYPFNVGHHPGTNCQEVTRALIARTVYLDRQIRSFWNTLALFGYRLALWSFERRAATRHRRHMPLKFIGLELEPTCSACGHIGCTGNHKAHAA